MAAATLSLHVPIAPASAGSLRDLVQTLCASGVSAPSGCASAAAEAVRAHLAHCPLLAEGDGAPGGGPAAHSGGGGDDDADSGSALGSPVMIAAAHGRSDLLEVLLSAGASPNFAGRTSDVSLTNRGVAAAVDRWVNGAASPLYVSAAGGHAACVTLLLLSGADPNQPHTKTGATPLFACCERGDAACASRLLAGGASVDQPRTSDGLTPLAICCAHGHLDCARVLVQSGASADVRSVSGETPLSLAFAFAQTLNAPQRAECCLALLSHDVRSGAARPEAPGATSDSEARCIQAEVRAEEAEARLEEAARDLASARSASLRLEEKLANLEGVMRAQELKDVAGQGGGDGDTPRTRAMREADRRQDSARRREERRGKEEMWAATSSLPSASTDPAQHAAAGLPLVFDGDALSGALSDSARRSLAAPFEEVAGAPFGSQVGGGRPLGGGSSSSAGGSSKGAAAVETAAGNGSGKRIAVKPLSLSKVTGQGAAPPMGGTPKGAAILDAADINGYAANDSTRNDSTRTAGTGKGSKATGSKAGGSHRSKSRRGGSPSAAAKGVRPLSLSAVGGGSEAAEVNGFGANESTRGGGAAADGDKGGGGSSRRAAGKKAAKAKGSTGTGTGGGKKKAANRHRLADEVNDSYRGTTEFEAGMVPEAGMVSLPAPLPAEAAAPYVDVANPNAVALNESYRGSAASALSTVALLPAPVAASTSLPADGMANPNAVALNESYRATRVVGDVDDQYSFRLSERNTKPITLLPTPLAAATRAA